MDVMVFLRMWMGGGVEGTDVIDIYLPVRIGAPALLVLTALYGRRWSSAGRAEAGTFQGGLRCWIKVGLLVRRELGNQ